MADEDRAREREQLTELWAERVNAMVEGGVSRELAAEAIMVAALGMAIAVDGYRATARNLYLASVRLGGMADRQDAERAAGAALLKAGFRLN